MPGHYTRAAGRLLYGSKKLIREQGHACQIHTRNARLDVTSYGSWKFCLLQS